MRGGRDCRGSNGAGDSIRAAFDRILLVHETCIHVLVNVFDVLHYQVGACEVDSDHTVATSGIERRRTVSCCWSE